MFFISINALHVSGGFFLPSSGAYKTVYAALGIVMLSWNSSNTSIRAADSSIRNKKIKILL